MEKTWVQSAVQHGLRAVQSSVHLTDLLGTLLEWNSRSGVRSLQWVGRAADITSCPVPSSAAHLASEKDMGENLRHLSYSIQFLLQVITQLENGLLLFYRLSQDDSSK